MPLSFFDEDSRDYVIPTNPILGERVLRHLVSSNADLLFEVYCSVGSYLAPYVNRAAICRKTPEARLAQRLFDYDGTVLDLIRENSEAFYLQMKSHWEWTSRYWEQFALLKLDKFLKATSADRFELLSQSVSHARFAVRIERHPFTLTTLGRVLIEQMKQVADKFEQSFSEAFKCLQEAIRAEKA